MLIAGDIGGTKTLLALYTPQDGARKPLQQTEFHSANYASLGDIVREFVAKSPQPVQAACFDVAGPVIDGKAHLTNLPWRLDEQAMQQALGLKHVVLINDLKAVAYAVPHLNPEDLHTINEGQPDPKGPMAVIAPGTGLGEAFLIRNESGYIACSSEGGHADFAPNDELQAALWHYMSGRFGHVGAERVCSGSGLPNIYDFLRDTGRETEPPAFAIALAATHDRAPLIVQAAMEDPENTRCRATLDIFVSILGAEAGNLALKVLATGGLYLGGGIPPRILPNLEDGRFMRAFCNKGRLSEVLQKTPVKVITCQAALLGAALYGLDQIK